MFPSQRSPLHLVASTRNLSRTQLPQLPHIISQILLKYLIKLKVTILVQLEVKAY